MKTPGQKWYAIQLTDPRWQMKRLEILRRDDCKCVKCGKTENNMQVDHVRYIPGRKPWEYPDELLQTLCNFHHQEKSELTVVLNAGAKGAIRPRRVLPTPLKKKTSAEWDALNKLTKGKENA